MRNNQIKLEKLNRNELYRYLGYNTKFKDNTPDETVRGIIDEYEEKLFKVIHPAYVWRAFNICKKFDGDKYKGMEFMGTNLILEGESIRKHLSKCDEAILLCATLSNAADKLIRQTQLKDMAKALIVDTIASTAIEQVCNIAEEQIRNLFEDKYMTYRFGVGYGDLPLYHEPMILDILSANKSIGLSCTEANILTPVKSVMCVIGLSNEPLEKGQKGCATCNMKDRCSYRKQGLICSY